MILENYVELAKQTESVVLDLNDLNLRLLHSSMGLATEIIEFNEIFYNYSSGSTSLDEIGLLEEISDAFWYVAIGCDLLSINFSQIINESKDSCSHFDITEKYVSNAEIIIGEILDACKRHIFYKKSYDKEKIIELYIKLIKDLHKIVISLGYELEPQLEKNIAKLKHRYPEKYSDYHAINRDLETERKILES